MTVLMTMIADLVIVAVLASFCDMLLPETGVKRPVQLVFGLYFMALMLNPLVSLWTDNDFSAMDFSSLGEVRLNEAQTEFSEEVVYREAAATVSGEIEMKLERIYEGSSAKVHIVMDESGFIKVSVSVIGGVADERIATAEIQDLLVEDYGIPKDVLKISIQ